MVTNIDALFVDSTLLRQAEQLCQRRLQKAPENQTALRSLGEVYRKLGNLRDAAATYDRLFQLNPANPEVGYMRAVLNGEEWPIAPTGIHAAPFVLLRDFLPREFHETLMPFLISVQEKFVRSLVADSSGRGQYNPNFRDTLDFTDKWEGKRRFMDYFKEVIPRTLPRLHVAPGRIHRVEIHVRAYQDGHFFKVHMDAVAAHPDLANRVISFVYFFHRVPRPYTGGDLLLFDSDIEANKFTKDCFTRVVPEDNALIVFPSAFYHCVVPVRCSSNEFADSRFVINGFVSKCAPTPVDEAARSSTDKARSSLC